MGVAIAVISLAFAMGTFWWQYWRRGRLEMPEPHSFAMVSDRHVALVRLPVALINRGARTVLVQNLRLWLPGQNDIEALPWRFTRRQLRPDSGDDKDFPAPFMVRGHDVVVLFAEFGHPLPGFVIRRGDQPARVEAILGGKSGWQQIADFTLRVPTIETIDLTSYLAHDNTPINWRFDKRALDKKTSELLASLRIPPDPRPPNQGDAHSGGV